MKFIPSIVSGLCGGAMLLLPIVAPAQTLNPALQVRIEVQVKADGTRTKDKTTNAETNTQNKTLSITVTGKPKVPETRTGKWYIYGRDAKDHDVSIAQSGDFKIEFPASGQQKVESEKVTLTYTPEHALPAKGGGGKGGGGAAKKVEATGTKYVGYGVVVKDGDLVVGEYYDPLGVKAEAAKAK